MAARAPSHHLSHNSALACSDLVSRSAMSIPVIRASGTLKEGSVAGLARVAEQMGDDCRAEREDGLALRALPVVVGVGRTRELLALLLPQREQAPIFPLHGSQFRFACAVLRGGRPRGKQHGRSAERG